MVVASGRGRKKRKKKDELNNQRVERKRNVRKRREVKREEKATHSRIVTSLFYYPVVTHKSLHHCALTQQSVTQRLTQRVWSHKAYTVTQKLTCVVTHTTTCRRAHTTISHTQKLTHAGALTQQTATQQFTRVSHEQKPAIIVWSHNNMQVRSHNTSVTQKLTSVSHKAHTCT